MRKLSKRSTAVVAGIAVAVIGGGAAWAATGWTIGGSGAAKADAATITDLTATSTFAAKLYPGLSTTVISQVHNTNDFKVALNAASGAVTSFDGTPTGPCKTALIAKPGIFTTTFPGNPEIGPHTGPGGQTISSNVVIGDLPQSCAGTAITINYTFTGVSKA